MHPEDDAEGVGDDPEAKIPKPSLPKKRGRKSNAERAAIAEAKAAAEHVKVEGDARLANGTSAGADQAADCIDSSAGDAARMLAIAAEEQVDTPRVVI